MKSYFTFFKLRIITNLQYRAAALAGISTQFFFGLVFLMVYLAFYESGAVNKLPMEWPHLVNYIWLMQAFYALIYPYEKDTELLHMIQKGDLAYELIRPQNFYLKWYIKIFSKKLVAVLLRFWPIIIVGFLLPSPINLTLPNSWTSLTMFLITLINASILVTGISLLMHIIAIYTLSEKGIMAIMLTISEIFMGGVIPLPFFPNWLLNIANILPFRYIGDVPFRIYSGSIVASKFMGLFIGSIFWILIIIALGYYLAHNALKKAVIQGG